ncbi:MAG: biotin synthase BioB [Planctomycetota bacterium]
MDKLLINIAKEALQNRTVDKDDYLKVITKTDIYDLMYATNQLRRFYFHDRIEVTTLLNAKSGACLEDCKFCSQSSYYRTHAPVYPLAPYQVFLDSAKYAINVKADRLCIVTSGNQLNEDEFNQMCQNVKKIKEQFNGDRIRVCCSIGMQTLERVKKLKESGVDRIHNNLETSRRMFSSLCTTHSYEDKLKTLQAIRDGGAEMCAGGVFGLGEDWEDRIDLAFDLKLFEPESVPINFLVPIKGTPFEKCQYLTPQEALKIICLYRLIFPKATIRVSGGREYNLRTLQSQIFFAGANSIVTGGYLTVKGSSPENDYQMIKDCGLKLNREVDTHDTDS